MRPGRPNGAGVSTHSIQETPSRARIKKDRIAAFLIWRRGVRPGRPNGAGISTHYIQETPSLDDNEKAAYQAAFEVGGEGGIRTLGTANRTTDFESVSFDHSDTSPLNNLRVEF